MAQILISINVKFGEIFDKVENTSKATNSTLKKGLAAVSTGLLFFTADALSTAYLRIAAATAVFASACAANYFSKENQKQDVSATTPVCR